MRVPNGWIEISTGGNCTAWEYQIGRAGHALLTQAGDPMAPTRNRQRVTLGLYDAENDRQRVAIECDSVAEALTIARKVSFINEVEF